VSYASGRAAPVQAGIIETGGGGRKGNALGRYRAAQNVEFARQVKSALSAMKNQPPKTLKTPKLRLRRF
jgi:hypothetical protein